MNANILRARLAALFQALRVVVRAAHHLALIYVMAATLVIVLAANLGNLGDTNRRYCASIGDNCLDNQHYLGWLNSIAAFEPLPNTSLRERRAEVYFAQQRHSEAALLLPPTRIQTSHLGAPVQPSTPFSRFSRSNTFENAVVAAYQAFQVEDWGTTVKAFQLATILGPNELTIADHQTYFAALAYQQIAQANPANLVPRQQFQIGMVLLRADRTNEATEWISGALRADGQSALTTEERSQAWTGLGLAREQLGSTADAISAYEQAAYLNPSNREPRLRLLAILKQRGGHERVATIVAELGVLGPTRGIGALGPQFILPGRQESLQQLPNGWSLAGVDIDEDLLGAGGLTSIWVWWVPPRGELLSASRDWVDVGDYRVQHLVTTNLLPNPHFVWGADKSGVVPLGYNPVDINTLSHAQNVDFADGPVLMGTQSGVQLEAHGRYWVKLRSFPFVIQANSLYLLAFSQQASGQWATFAQCGAGRELFSINGTEATDLRVARGFTFVGFRQAGAMNPCTLDLATSGNVRWDGLVLIQIDPLPK